MNPFRQHALVFGLLSLGYATCGLPRAESDEQSAGQTARVATVAMHSELGDYETNLKRIRHWAGKAHQAQATFVVFPELCVTGSLCNSKMPQSQARALAEKAMQAAVPRLETMCRELDMTIVVGIVEPVENGFRNSALVIGPQGHLTTYHKLWLPNANEEKWFQAGKRLPVIDSQGWKFSVGICADINHQAYFDAAARQGAELMLCPIGGSGRDSLANKETGDQTKQAEFHRNLHMKFLPTRASSSRMYVFYANQAGRSGDYWYPGLALALDPHGKLVGEHRPTEGMIVTDISKKLLAKARRQPAKAKGRPPENSTGQRVAVVVVDSAATTPTHSSPDKPFRALPFQVKLDTVLEHDDGKFLWFHPRAVAVPTLGRNGQPAVFMTLQKHLNTSDHYSGLSIMRTNDLGKTWSRPDPRPELDWVRKGDVDIAVADVTPGWHPQSRKVIAVGAQVRYSSTGRQLEDIRRAHQTAYAVLDPQTGHWTRWRQLQMPDTDQFNFARSACAQFVIDDDGTVLLPFYIGASARVPWSVTVARFSFDGEQLRYQRHGTLLPLKTGRGYAEPSLVKLQKRYFLTIRSNRRAHVTSSDDGLNFSPTAAWTFDDGRELGSYNTQQHWLVLRDGLFLTYTRRGANNDHIMRHRAPLFIAQVDPVKLHIVRATERTLVPERGATLGNFGAMSISPNESWVTVCEGIWSDGARKRGATGALFVARVTWSAEKQRP